MARLVPAGRSEGAMGQPRAPSVLGNRDRERGVVLSSRTTTPAKGWTGALEMSKVTPREYKDMRYIIGIAAVAVLALLMYIGVTAGR